MKKSVFDFFNSEPEEHTEEQLNTRVVRTKRLKDPFRSNFPQEDCSKLKFSQVLGEIIKSTRKRPVYSNRNRLSVGKSHDSSLVPTSRLPLNLKSLFDFAHFNKIQSKCFAKLVESRVNLCVSSPTGSGKTTLFELALIKEMLDTCLSSKKLQMKAVYLAPIKSLCQEKLFSWKTKFSNFNLTVAEATSDSQGVSSCIFSSDIILATPERLEGLTKDWSNDFDAIAAISLVMVDEIHLLGEEQRGTTLECLLTRLMFLSSHVYFKEKPISKLRIISVSATIPNIKEIGLFTRCLRENIIVFGPEYRPIKVHKIVYGYNNPSKNEFQFEKSLNFRLAKVIKNHSANRPSLVFCQTQKGTLSACDQLLKDKNELCFFFSKTEKEKQETFSKRAKDKKLKGNCLKRTDFEGNGLSPRRNEPP